MLLLLQTFRLINQLGSILLQHEQSELVKKNLINMLNMQFFFSVISGINTMNFICCYRLDYVPSFID